MNLTKFHKDSQLLLYKRIRLFFEAVEISNNYPVLLQEHLAKQKSEGSDGATAGPSTAPTAPGVGASGSTQAPGSLAGASSARPVNEAYVQAVSG